MTVGKRDLLAPDGDQGPLAIGDVFAQLRIVRVAVESFTRAETSSHTVTSR
jgi:hypothetical protein